MESISTTSSLRIQMKKSVKSSVFRQRISLVRHRQKELTDRACWIWRRVINVVICVAFPPRSTADTSSYQTSLQAVAESADERSGQKETGYHSQECHLGRYCGFDRHSPGRILAIIKKIKKNLNTYLRCLDFLCTQARQRKCSATWPETSWNLWWMWSTSCWAPESMSPSTMGSWT